MVNKVTLIGNLGSDPEIRILESGTKVAKFSLATNENYKDKSGEWKQMTEWHNVIAWRYNADKAERLSKGDQVYITGKITYRSYTDKDNVERYATDIVAREIRQLGKNESSENSYGSSSPSGESDSPGMKPFDKTITEPTENQNSSQSDTEDDLPF